VRHEASDERGAGTARTSLGGLTSRQQPLWAEQLALVARLTDEPTARRVQLAIEYDPHPPFGGIDWEQVNRDIYEPMLGPMVQQQLADRPELLAKLSD
jgi:hypothetical protein